MWVKDRNPNEKEFIENYVRNHHGAEFVVMIKNADRPTTLYHTSEGYWIDENGNFYDVIAWTTLPQFDEISQIDDETHEDYEDEEYKSCENCYYEEFDEYAYPCAMCIRGYTRKDKWQPKRSLSQNEPLDCLKCAQRGRCERGRAVDCPLRKKGW